MEAFRNSNRNQKDLIKSKPLIKELRSGKAPNFPRKSFKRICDLVSFLKNFRDLVFAGEEGKKNQPHTEVSGQDLNGNQVGFAKPGLKKITALQ